MRILVFAWAVVLVVHFLRPADAEETKRKKLVVVVPEKVRHIHHHHVKKIYIKSKPHYHYSSYEEGLHREGADGSYEVDEHDVGAIKFKPHGHRKRHSSSSRHPDHKEENKKVVVHSDEFPDASTWHEDKSTESHTHTTHHTEDSTLKAWVAEDDRPSGSSHISTIDHSQEQKTIVFLDSDASIPPEKQKNHLKSSHHDHHDHHDHHHHHHHHDHHSHGHKERPNHPQNHNVINHEVKSTTVRSKPLHSVPNEIIDKKPPPFEVNRPKPAFIENLVPPPVNHQSYTQVNVGSSGFTHSQSAGPPRPVSPPVPHPHPRLPPPPPPPPQSRPSPPSNPRPQPPIQFAQSNQVKAVRSAPPPKTVIGQQPANGPNRPGPPPTNQRFKAASVQRQPPRLWRQRFNT